MSPDVVEDWISQMEYVDAECLLDMRQEGMQRRWAAGAGPAGWHWAAALRRKGARCCTRRASLRQAACCWPLLLGAAAGRCCRC